LNIKNVQLKAMVRFLKPTKVMWVVIGVFFIILVVPYFIPETLIQTSYLDNKGFVHVNNIFIPALFLLYFTLHFYDQLGLPVGGLIFSPPSNFDILLAVITDLIVIYFLAQLISKIWYKFIKNKNSNLQATS